MSFSLQRYFPNLFVAIVLESNTCKLLGKVVKKGQIIQTFETIFDNSEEHKLESKVIKYLQDKEDEYHAIYVSFFLNTAGQGALEGTHVLDFERSNIDVKTINHINIEEDWSSYVTDEDLKLAKDAFAPMELDLLYSPFMLLYHCINSRALEEKPTLYIYNHEKSFTVGIFDKTKLLFGEFFSLEHTAEPQKPEINWDEDDEIENLVELEDIKTGDEDIYDLDEYETLGDLEDDLDLQSEKDEILDLDGQKILEEIRKDEILEDKEASIALLGRDMNMYSHLVDAIKEFYKNPRYKHEFIENIIIFDNYDTSEAIVNMIESQLLMNVRVQKVKTLELLCELAIKDMNL